MKTRILIIDDDADICALLEKYLIQKGFMAESALSASGAFQKLKDKKFDIVFCDYRLGDTSGLDVLTAIKKDCPRTEVIIITAYSDIKTAVHLIKSGAFDYMCKPLIPDELINIIKKALEHRRQKEETPSPIGFLKAKAKHGIKKDPFFRGSSPPIKEVYRQVEIVAPTDYSIILHGESGSGKEVIAKTIHQKSNRRDQPFVALDCGTLSRELANSELFGHVKGSFTGAISDKKGHFEMADGGTLFLDEVANLSFDIQASLLRVIQERKIKRIGSTKEINLDIRIIVASHEDLRKAYLKHLFREDLFHRLNEFSIKIPPLRDRKTDIPNLADYFLDITNKETGKLIEGFDEEVMEKFLNYAWPGNIRELRNMIRKAVLLTPSGKITTEVLSSELFSTYSHTDEWPAEQESDPAPSKKVDLKGVSMEVEYQTIMDVLKSVNFNKSKAAKILNIDRKTLYNKIKGHEEHEE